MATSGMCQAAWPSNNHSTLLAQAREIRHLQTTARELPWTLPALEPLESHYSGPPPPPPNSSCHSLDIIDSCSECRKEEKLKSLFSRQAFVFTWFVFFFNSFFPFPTGKRKEPFQNQYLSRSPSLGDYYWLSCASNSKSNWHETMRNVPRMYCKVNWLTALRLWQRESFREREKCK